MFFKAGCMLIIVSSVFTQSFTIYKLSVNIHNFSFSQPTNNAWNNNYTNQDPFSSMEVDKFAHRGRSSVLNHNQQRSQSTKSKASSMDYADRMQTQNHQLWANQLEEKKQDIPSQVNVPHVHNEANLSTP